MKKIALVFGNEETGLTREELKPCTHLCSIPTSEEMGSMNLSHAVAVVAARIYEQEREAGRARPPAGRRLPARLAEFEAMLGHWREFLVDVGLTQAGNPERILGTLRRALERSGLTPQELRAIRGVLSKAQVRLGTRKRGKRVS